MLVRKYRFSKEGQGSNASAHEILAKIQEEKAKIEERAKKFGLETSEMRKEKIKQRLERFGKEAPEGTEREVLDLDKQKMAERAARFGIPEKPQKERKNVLEMSLSDYKMKK